MPSNLVIATFHLFFSSSLSITGCVYWCCRCNWCTHPVCLECGLNFRLLLVVPRWPFRARSRSVSSWAWCKHPNCIQRRYHILFSFVILILNWIFTFLVFVGHSWVVAVRELSSIHHSITFEVVEAEPASIVSSIVHTISLKRVSGNATTFVEWITDFSSDATSEVVLDSAFKRQEAIADLSRAVRA